MPAAGTNTRVSVFGALDYTTGAVTSHLAQRADSESFMAFLEQLLALGGLWQGHRERGLSPFPSWSSEIPAGYRCLAGGLSFKISAGSVLTLSPPLTIARDDLDRALAIVARAVREEAAA